MAVANRQIDEVLRVVLDFVSPSAAAELFDRLIDTEAYRSNKSFRDTVNMLQARLAAPRRKEDR